jgi:hypothetical protein
MTAESGHVGFAAYNFLPSAELANLGGAHRFDADVFQEIAGTLNSCLALLELNDRCARFDALSGETFQVRDSARVTGSNARNRIMDLRIIGVNGSRELDVIFCCKVQDFLGKSREISENLNILPIDLAFFSNR